MLLSSEAARRDGESEVVLTPAGRGGHPRARGLRVTGPGRREREYLDRIGDLQRSVEGLHRTLDHAALVERGAGRRMDRLERDLVDVRAREERAREQLHRTLVVLGATQREVEGLRLALERSARRPALTAGPAPQPEREGAPKGGWLRQLAHKLRR
ncbi:MAG: hypothetical protein R3F49_02270 [Planctomycetota bacterium]